MAFPQIIPGGVRTILGRMVSAIDRNFVSVNSNLSLSKLVETKAITPEFADFTLGMQYDKDHFHLVRSQSRLEKIERDLPFLAGFDLCNAYRALPLRASDGSFVIVVGDIANFDYENFFLEFSPLAAFFGENPDESNIHVCHQEGFQEFFQQITW